MKLFISYSRDDKAWVAELWRALRDENHDAWMDRFIAPASDWWESILREVEACECFIYVMTPKSTDSIYCRAELDYAVALNKPILPLMLKSCTFPDNLSQTRVQFQTITDDMDLIRVLLRIEQGFRTIEADKGRGKYVPKEAKRPSEPKASRDPVEALDIAEDALKNRNYSVAEKMLEEVASGNHGVLSEVAQDRLTEIRQDRQCGDEYAKIKRLANSPNTLELAKRAWKTYRAGACGEYDFDNLAAQLETSASAQSQPTPPTPAQPVISESKPVSKPASQTLSSTTQSAPDSPLLVPRSSARSGEVQGVRADKIRAILPPPFDWCPITAGQVTLERINKTFDVSAFDMAKYPVTNAQFQVFVDAKDGYCDTQWWAYSEAAKAWRKANSKSQKTGFVGNTHPRTNVCWYEAIAFCQWLSVKTGETITLPTEWQWQRAVEGDQKLNYPWGNRWNETRCNNNNLWGATPVTKYEGKGDSPFKVVDMSGNVWELCLNEYHLLLYDVFTINGKNIIAVRGGSSLEEGIFSYTIVQDTVFLTLLNFNTRHWGFGSFALVALEVKTVQLGKAHVG